MLRHTYVQFVPGNKDSDHVSTKRTSFFMRWATRISFFGTKRSSAAGKLTDRTDKIGMKTLYPGYFGLSGRFVNKWQQKMRYMLYSSLYRWNTQLGHYLENMMVQKISTSTLAVS